MLRYMLDLDALMRRMGSNSDQQDPPWHAARFLDAAKARLEYAAHLARRVESKDSAVGALSMLHSLLCLSRDSFEQSPPRTAG